jgi:tetratricopeptide (TPR) repeat protein
MKDRKKNKSIEKIRVDKNRLIIYLLFLVLVPFTLYIRTVNFNFSNFDDTNLISDNYNIISNLENLPKAFTTDAFFSHESNFYRPLQTVSFMVDAQICGKDTWAYHLTNLLLIILIAIALFILLNKFGINQEFAFCLSLLYAVHPLLTSAVCWIPAQGDLYLTLFGLMSFISFINYFDTKKTKYLIYYTICFILSCLAKETALIFPFLLTFYFYFILKKEKLWKEIIPMLIIWCISFLFYFFLRSIALSVNKTSALSGIGAFIKNLPAIPITFGKLFIPLNLSPMPLFDNLSIILGLFVFIIFLAILVKYKLYQNAYIIFGAIWFLVFTLPPLYFRFTIAEFSAEYFEHRTLLPMVGILIMLGISLSSVFNKLSLNKVFRISIPIIILYMILAYIHSGDYSGPITFFSSAIAANSNNAAALNCRGSEYLQSGNVQMSLVDYDNAIKICPVYSSPYVNKGNIYHDSGDELKAEYYYSQALKYDTLYRNINFLMADKAYINLSSIKMNLKKYDEAIVLLKKALNGSPDNNNLYNNLGFAYYSKTNYDSALSAFSSAIKFQPNTASYYTNRGMTKYFLKDYNGALKDYNSVLVLDPNSAGNWYNSGKTKIELNDFTGAIADFSYALKINPQWGEAYFYRGIAYSKQNKEPEAEKDRAEARRLGYKLININPKEK